ncbi:MAG: DUF11 domain-containing protein [Gammaproteobacteria bacterium]|nr:DUF11 domain-containing protein [Gammaproteobacteria bacterium]
MARPQLSPARARRSCFLVVTNTGNGTEGFQLAINNAFSGDDFDPVASTPAAIYFDTDASGDFSAGDIAYTPGSNDPLLAPDASVDILLVNDIPASLADGATVVQISDVLPAGVTFVSAVVSQGAYDSVTGAWFVGTVGAGSNATLSLQATVDAGTAGTTITNTASVAFLSQHDSNAGNDIDSADIVPTAANLTVLKCAVTVRDPLGAVAPAALAIPGATVEYEISVTNSGNGDATEIIVTDTLDSNVAFLAGDYNAGTADVEIIVGAAPPVFCIAEVGGDTNADGCFLNAAGDFLTVSIPVSGSYPTGLTVGTTAPDNAVAVHFRVTVN